MQISEEEKKAVEDIKGFLKEYLEKGFFGIIKTERMNNLKIVLNLIEKQNKEIEYLKNLNEHQSKEITKAVDYTFELNKESEIKDKMIDELIDELTCDEWDSCCGNCTHECEKDYYQLNFCVKEYFRKKVEINE